MELFLDKYDLSSGDTVFDVLLLLEKKSLISFSFFEHVMFEMIAMKSNSTECAERNDEDYAERYNDYLKSRDAK